MVVMTESTEKLSFRDHTGRRRTMTVRFEGSPTADGSGLFTQAATADDGQAVVKRWLPADLLAERNDLCDLLENETRAGMRLATRFPDRYPAEVVRMLGYDVDGAEPFVLLAPSRGRPIGDVGQLMLDDQRRFHISLLTGLVVLAEAQLVHNRLSQVTVRWDGSTAQIGSFGYAAVIGDARPGGRGRVTADDDMWAAGQLILWVATGRADHTDLASRGPALRTLLEGVFASAFEDIPTAEDLLRRLGVTPRLPAPDPEVARTEARGRKLFDRTLAEHWPDPVQRDIPFLNEPPLATKRIAVSRLSALRASLPRWVMSLSALLIVVTLLTIVVVVRVVSN
jgi:hypothetical protein